MGAAFDRVLKGRARDKGVRIALEFGFIREMLREWETDLGMTDTWVL